MWVYIATGIAWPLTLLAVGSFFYARGRRDEARRILDRLRKRGGA